MSDIRVRVELGVTYHDQEFCTYKCFLQHVLALMIGITLIIGITLSLTATLKITSILTLTLNLTPVLTLTLSRHLTWPLLQKRP